jgi:hypothetical protein
MNESSLFLSRAEHDYLIDVLPELIRDLFSCKHHWNLAGIRFFNVPENMCNTARGHVKNMKNSAPDQD